MSRENGDEPRNFLSEARKILKGETMLLPEVRHLEALHEAHECEIIRVINALHDIKMRILTAEQPRV